MDRARKDLGQGIEEHADLKAKGLRFIGSGVSGGEEGGLHGARAFVANPPVPLDRIASADPCLGHDYEACPLFKDVLTRIRAHSQPASTAAATDTPVRREVFR